MADRLIPAAVWNAYRAQVREVCTLGKELSKHGGDHNIEAELMGAIDGLRRLDSLVASMASATTKRRR